MASVVYAIVTIYCYLAPKTDLSEGRRMNRAVLFVDWSRQTAHIMAVVCVSALHHGLHSSIC